MQTVLSWVLFPWVWKAFSPNVQIKFFCRKVNFPATKHSGRFVITFLIIYAVKGTFLLFIRSCEKKLPSSFSVQAWGLLPFFFSSVHSPCTVWHDACVGGKRSWWCLIPLDVPKPRPFNRSNLSSRLDWSQLHVYLCANFLPAASPWWRTQSIVQPSVNTYT